MKWFKFYGQDYLSDPKMLALSASQRSCWITLLAYASVNDNGTITFLSEQQLMLQSGLDFTDDEWERTVGILEKLQNLDMISVDNGMITILNWKKRQGESLTGYQRLKRYREKKRRNDNNDNDGDNKMITIEENRIDKNRREKNNNDFSNEKSLLQSIQNTDSPLKKEERTINIDEEGNERPQKVKKVSQGKKNSVVADAFYNMCFKELNIKPIKDLRYYSAIKYATGTAGLTDDQVIDLFKDWFARTDKRDDQLVHITQALSGNNIENYKVNNQIK